MRNNKYVIFQITPASTGGIGRLTRDISDILPKEMFEMHIAYAGGKIIEQGRDFMFGTKYDVMYHGLMTRLTDKMGMYSKSATKQLLDYMEESKVDLVHLHNLHGYYINIPMLFEYLAQKNIPVIWTLHECWAMTGHCTHFSYVGCDKWKSHCSKCPQTSSYPKAYVDNSQFNHNMKRKYFTMLRDLTVVTPSEWLRDLVRQSYLAKYNSYCFHNGIDLSTFRMKSPEEIVKLTDKKVILGLASTFNDRKGFSDFISLSRILPEEYQIVMVGIKPYQLNKLPKNIIGITHTENVEQLVDIYNQAYLFLNLTYEDNFPTTNLEAQACGTSVLTYRTGGSVESVTQDTGYIVEQGDLENVRKIVLQHSKTEDTIKACVINAKEYDRKLTFQKYVNLYKKKLLLQ